MPTVSWASDDQVDEFFDWLAARFGDWDLPTVYFRVKAQTRCRVEDLCALPSAAVGGGAITFTAELVKGRKARSIPISTDLFSALERIKGDRYVWEHYPAGLRKVLEALEWPTHRLKPEFKPRRVAGWVMTLFRAFNDARPDQPKLTSHMFRKRAFTLAKKAGIDSRDAAVAFGCNPDTMAMHYIGVTDDEITAGVAAKLAGLLDRKEAGATPAPASSTDPRTKPSSGLTADR
jgi:integrase